MIKADGPSIEVRGSQLVIKAEISSLVHALVYDMNDGKGLFTKEEILKLVAGGLLTADELRAQIRNDVKSDPVGTMRKALTMYELTGYLPDPEDLFGDLDESDEAEDN